jgi:hypothetical protein
VAALLGGVSGHGDGSTGRRNKVKIRCSNTLADDEGVVFATNLPSSSYGNVARHRQAEIIRALARSSNVQNGRK